VVMVANLHHTPMVLVTALSLVLAIMISAQVQVVRVELHCSSSERGKLWNICTPDSSENGRKFEENF